MFNRNDPEIRNTWWNRNKGIILGTIAVVATTVAVAQNSGLRAHNTFLKDRGLLEEYYTPED